MIRKTLDPVLECCNYCMLAFNEQKLSIIQEENKNDPISLQIEKKILMIQKNMKHNVKPYFETILNKTTLAHILLISFYDYQSNQLKDAKETIQKNFHEYSLNEFPEFMIEMYGMVFEENDKRVALTETLKNIEMKDQERFMILSAFMNYDAIVEEIFNFFETIVELVCNEDLTSFIQYWKEKDTVQKISQLWEKAGLDLVKENNLFIVPTTSDPLLFSLRAKDENQTVLLIIGINTTLDFLDEKVLHIVETDRILKLLSDPSKYAILKLIKDQSYYGAEIAKIMNLKTSTISYHLNACIEAKLVHVRKVENKIYFELNHQTIQSFIHELENDFLSKEKYIK